MASKSLGTLTLDLVAKTSSFVAGMDKAARASDKWRKEVTRHTKQAAVAFASFTGAAATAAVAIGVSTQKAAIEIGKLSAVAGASADEFQRYAVGAESAGISNEKFADILKDVNDKVGDFLATGGGGLRDFFEQIAPQVGVTADQFRNLSGPQALGLYVDSLEKANASQADMTFYLEAIASDSTLLLPLLRDGAKGFREFGDAAADAGAILSDDTIKSARELEAVTLLLGLQFDGFKNSVASDLLPVVSDLAKQFGGLATNESVSAAAAELLGDSLRRVLAVMVGVGAAADLSISSVSALLELGSKLKGGARFGPLTPAFAAYTLATEGEEVLSIIEKNTDSLEAKALKWAGVIDGILNAGTASGSDGTDEFQQRVENIAALLDSFQARTGGGASSAIDDGGADKITDQIDALKMQAATLGMTAEQVELYKLSLNGADEAQIRQAQSLLESIRIYEDGEAALKDFQERQAAINAEAQSIAESLETEEESIRRSYERRKDIILKNTEVTGQARQELLLRLEQDTNEKLGELNASFWENYLSAAEDSLTNLDDIVASTINNFASSFGNVIEGLIFDAESLDDALYELASGFARSVVSALAEMAAQWLVYQAVQLAVGKTTQASAAATITANAVAQQQMAALAAYASTAAIPIVGPSLAPAAAAIALASTTPFVAAASAAAISGIAHDGLMSVPKTGTYILEKGERVTTAETSAKLDKTLSDVQGGGTGGKNIRIVNSFDAGEVVGGFMGSDSGEELIMNVVRRNSQTIKSLAV